MLLRLVLRQLRPKPLTTNLPACQAEYLPLINCCVELVSQELVYLLEHLALRQSGIASLHLQVGHTQIESSNCICRFDHNCAFERGDGFLKLTHIGQLKAQIVVSNRIVRVEFYCPAKCFGGPIMSAQSVVREANAVLCFSQSWFEREGLLIGCESSASFTKVVVEAGQVAVRFGVIGLDSQRV